MARFCGQMYDYAQMSKKHRYFVAAKVVVRRIQPNFRKFVMLRKGVVYLVSQKQRTRHFLRVAKAEFFANS